MRRAKYVGINGVAGCGKDLFFKLLKQCLEAKKGDNWLESEIEPKVSRYALADSLKKEINEFTKSKYGINSLTCSLENKEKMRPLMLFHGLMMRDKTKGRYWIEQLDKKIKKDDPKGIICVTDIRYDEYEEDEIHWIKKEKEGILVHIRLIETDEEGFLRERPPANEFEEKYNDKIRDQADYVLNWERINGPEEYKERKLSILYVSGFVDWLLDGYLPKQ